MVNIGVADVAVGEEVILWVLMHWVLCSCFLSYRKLSVVFKNAVAIGAVAVVCTPELVFNVLYFSNFIFCFGSLSFALNISCCQLL